MIGHVSRTLACVLADSLLMFANSTTKKYSALLASGPWVGVRVTRKIRVVFFGFRKLKPENYPKKAKPDGSGSRNFGFGLG